MRLGENSYRSSQRVFTEALEDGKGLDTGIRTAKEAEPYPGTQPRPTLVPRGLPFSRNPVALRRWWLTGNLVGRLAQAPPNLN